MSTNSTNTDSTTRRKGISTLETILAGALLLLLVTFALLFIGRKPAAPSQAALKQSDPRSATRAGARGGTPRQGNAEPGNDVSAGDAGAPAVADAKADWGWADESEPAQDAGPAYRASARTPVVSGNELRAYFSQAFAVPGRPNWPTFLSLARKLDPAQLPAAWSLLQEQPWSREKQAAMETLVEHWAQRDPEAAIEFALTLESAGERRTVYGTALKTWAATEPQAALAWYEAQQAGGAAGRLPVSSFFAGLYASAPQMALDLVWKMEEPRQQAHVLRSLFFPPDGDREQGALRLKAMFEATQDAGQRMLLANMVADVWAADDPMRAIAWAAELTNEPEVQQRIYLSAARAWGRREPEAAMAWLEEQGLAQTGPHALQHIAQAWEHDNPASLQRWLDSADPSPARDAVVAARIGSLQERAPSAAFTLAASVSDNNTRYRLMTTVADRWMQSDRDAAVAAVLASSLPPELKRKYALRVIPRNRK